LNSIRREIKVAGLKIGEIKVAIEKDLLHPSATG